jgi:hypothetical protein
MGITGRGQKPLHTLTSGIRAEVGKPGKTSLDHMVTGEPVNVSGGSYGRLREITQMVVMEELGIMCDRGDCWV